MQSSHEGFARPVRDRGPSDRSFGFVFCGIFALAGLWPLLRHQPVRIWALAISGTFLGLAWFYPAVLHHANVNWMRLAHLINRVVSPVAMGILFFLVFTPAALIMRAFGRDALGVRKDAAGDTYWLPRRPPGPPADNMENQF